MKKMHVSMKWMWAVSWSLAIAVSGHSARADTLKPEGFENEPWYRDGVGWALSGGGVIAAGTGAFLLVDATRLENNANTEPTQSVREQLRDRASARRIAGAVFGIVGVGAVVAGVVKLAIHDKGRATGDAALDIGVTRDSVFVMGRF